MTRTLKIAQLLYGYLVALNKINTLVIYRNVDLIQCLKGSVRFNLLNSFGVLKIFSVITSFESIVEAAK